MEQIGRSSFDGIPDDPVPCPRVAVPGPAEGGLLIRCDGTDERYGAGYTLAVPDARGAGIWIVSASAQLDAPHPSSDAFVALLEAATGAYG